MKLDFSDPVTDQHFSIMCIPRDTERQRLIEHDVRIEADVSAAGGTGAPVSMPFGAELDGLGNPYVYGVIHEPHVLFCLTSEGIVEPTGALYEEFEDPESVSLWRYRAESPFTAAGPALTELHRRWKADAPDDEYGMMLHYGNCVQQALSYVSGSTDVGTTAEQAVSIGSGLCQDYAHVMIALLRMSGIPARYVVGMIPGEGETHAWAEVNCRGYWYGIDPTNNALVNDNYIKFSHGRDYSECMISRGIFTNPYAVQRTDAGVTVQEIPQ